jgi:hypothetical protein
MTPGGLVQFLCRTKVASWRASLAQRGERRAQSCDAPETLLGGVKRWARVRRLAGLKSLP